MDFSVCGSDGGKVTRVHSSNNMFLFVVFLYIWIPGFLLTMEPLMEEDWVASVSWFIHQVWDQILCVALSQRMFWTHTPTIQFGLSFSDSFKLFILIKTCFKGGCRLFYNKEMNYDSFVRSKKEKNDHSLIFVQFLI